MISSSPTHPFLSCSDAASWSDPPIPLRRRALCPPRHVTLTTTTTTGRRGRRAYLSASSFVIQPSGHRLPRRVPIVPANANRAAHRGARHDSRQDRTCTAAERWAARDPSDPSSNGGRGRRTLARLRPSPKLPAAACGALYALSTSAAAMVARIALVGCWIGVVHSFCFL